MWPMDVQLEHEKHLKEEEKRRAEQAEEQPHGFLNLSRATDLDEYPSAETPFRVST